MALELPADLRSTMPNGDPIARWKVHEQANFIIMPYPPPNPQKFYCLECKKWLSCKTTPNKITAHLRRKKHGGQQPGERPLSPADRAQIFKAGILLHGLPLSMVEYPEFRLAVPGLPCRQTFTAQAVAIAAATKQALKDRLAQCKYLSIQFDIWTNRANQRFIGVMCHSCYEEKPYLCNLGTIPVTRVSCTGEYIAAELGKLLDEYDIDPMACVTDTDATEQKAFRLLNEARIARGEPAMDWLPCFCHLINLVLKEFMVAGSKLYAPLKVIENQLGHSAGFTEFCAEAGASRTRVAQSIDIRWASYHNAVASIIELQHEILVFRHNTPDDRKAIKRGEKLLPILARFKAVLEAFEGDNPGTIAQVSVLLKGLKIYLEGIRGTWYKSARAALRKLSEVQNTHFQHIYPICWVAARLNPQYQADDLLEDDIQAADMVIEREIQDFARQLAVDAGPNDGPPLTDYEQRLAEMMAFAQTGYGQVPPSSDDRVAAIMGQFRAFQLESDERRQGGTRLFRQSAMDYWMTKRYIWPELAEYAIRVLWHPITSAQTERHFSLTGGIEGLRRLRLLADHVDDLAMIMSNSDISTDLIYSMEAH
jgi:hypothetical protein